VKKSPEAVSPTPQKRLALKKGRQYIHHPGRDGCFKSQLCLCMRLCQQDCPNTNHTFAS